MRKWDIENLKTPFGFLSDNIEHILCESIWEFKEQEVSKKTRKWVLMSKITIFNITS